ncbi:hypothetical protein JCM24511_06567 [Saitozyma sp. JCM 24511]|nr:hypothetical protein JCM24511_06567 [Saitozyma sp. JCM 24511]
MSLLVRLLPLAALASVGASPISSDHLSGRLVHPHINRNNHARSIETRGGTAYVPPNVNLSSVQPNSAINSAAYHNLSNQLPVILSNAVSTSNHSWELGTLVETLLEVYNPELTPFGWNPNVANCDTSQVPWAALQIILASLYETNWTGAPSSGSPGANSSSSLQGLANYLNSSTSPTALTGATLIDGDGALGDPCSLGSGVWVLAQFCTRDDVRNALGAKSGESYAWAVGNQLQHLESGTRNDNGTISQREGYFELWSDMGFMIPPFPAYLGLSTGNQALLNISLAQWLLESSALLDTTVNIFRHINDWDARLWATGNGWMLYGAVRVLASVQSYSSSGSATDNAISSEVAQIQTTLSGVFTALFNQLDNNSLIPDYMNQPNATLAIGDSSGTALTVAAFYRFLSVCSTASVSDSVKSLASKAFDGVVAQIDSNGWLGNVVDPLGTNGWVVYPGSNIRSPEGQSFVGLMWAARTAAGI